MCLFVSPLPCLVRVCQLLRYADNRIVNILKVYIERNILQVELIRYRKQVDFIHVFFCEAMYSMQYRPPNVNQEFRTQTTLAHFLTVYADSRLRVNAWLVLKSWTYNDVLKLDTAFVENIDKNGS